jgi:drug/metabolite transporter (DMT)-like permease
VWAARGAGARLGLVLLAGVALGSTAVVTRLAVREVPPLVLVLLRLAVAAAAFGAVLTARPRPAPRGARRWADLALAGVLNVGVPLTAFTLALLFISSGVLTVTLALIPLFTGVLAHATLSGERLTGTRLGGCCCRWPGCWCCWARAPPGCGLAAGPRRCGRAMRWRWPAR